ncbi:leech-derived tryptase inhibitor C-like [Copidosoma floridanum]|uniref:leech-derived tryptase inhibitor C-like n=1 Tax=Copidosoma floridanum TaxID=29053 RepID=UPI0006C9B549|nr:leech-derived tryptase inhibitor C-like [Copidosoma floridanum]
MVKLQSIVILGVIMMCFVLSSEAQRKKPCDCAAITLYKPVCGTDGRTYGNSGQLGCYNKCNNKKVRVAHEGRCRN